MKTQKNKRTLIICSLLLVFCSLFLACGGDGGNGITGGGGGNGDHTHTWGEWGNSTATCTTVGVETRTCAGDATHTETRPIAATGHTDPAPTGYCTVCSALTLSIGDTGPGTGIIFYVADGLEGRPLGFTVEGHPLHDFGYGLGSGYIAHYLEAAPSNSGNALWGTGITISGMTTFTSTSSEDYDKIGIGRKDTWYIIEQYPSGMYAANLAVESQGGQTDWFLPSCGELNLLYGRRTRPGIGITSGALWSSSQYSTADAWNQNFGTGTRVGNSKSGTARGVRAIRAF